MAALAATQGLSVANSAYQSTIVQDALATGSIPHKMIFAVVMGGGGYLIASLVTSGGISGRIMGTEATLIDTSPIGWIGRAITGKSIGGTITGTGQSKGFLIDHAAAITGASCAILGFYLG